MESKNRLSRKMLDAFATEGSQMASGDPIRFQCVNGRLAMVTYCGTTSTVTGIISVASIMNSTTLPSTGRSLDSEYAAATSKTSWKASAPNAQYTVFHSI